MARVDFIRNDCNDFAEDHNYNADYRRNIGPDRNGSELLENLVRKHSLKNSTVEFLIASLELKIDKIEFIMKITSDESNHRNKVLLDKNIEILAELKRMGEG
jgi:hypothetical protein